MFKVYLFITNGTFQAIEKCFNDYGPKNVFLSFNGGKDCTVLLHLIHTVLSVKYPDYKEPIVCLYIKSENAFPEQDIFISQCKVYFNLELISVVQNIKEGLKEILSLKPNLAACFMGTRKTDPFSSNLKVFQMTDHNWPQVMRVSPLLNWHYSDIWDYLLYYKIPYCKLYDMGYTSLGNASNTIRNPSLLYNDIYLDTEVYLPAYKMLNENNERSGRNI